MRYISRIPIFLLFTLINLACPQPAPIGTLLPISTGAHPNDAIVVERENRATLIVAASMDSAIQFFDLNSEGNTIAPNPDKLFFLPIHEGVSPNPWSLAASSDGRYLVISLFDDHSVALADIASRKLLAIATPRYPGFSRPPLFALPQPVTLQKPKDVLGDGIKISNVSSMRAMHPTAIKINGNQVLVAFTNMLEWATLSGPPSQYGPGVVARFLLGDGKLDWVESIALPCLNPSDITFDNDDPIVVCSGRLEFNARSEMQLRDGAGLVYFETLAKGSTNTPSLKIVSSMELRGFSPAKGIAHKEGVFLSSNVKRQLLFVPRTAKTESESALIPLNPEKPDEDGFLPSFIRWDGDLAFISDFRNDQLIALHLDEKRLNPSPFTTPLRLNTEKPLIFKGPQAIARRGSVLYVLMNLSSEVIPVSPSKVLGQ